MSEVLQVLFPGLAAIAFAGLALRRAARHVRSLADQRRLLFLDLLLMLVGIEMFLDAVSDVSGGRTTAVGFDTRVISIVVRGMICAAAFALFLTVRRTDDPLDPPTSGE